MAEQIIGKLREAEVHRAEGKIVAEVARKFDVAEQTYYLWKQEHGGLRADKAERLKDRAMENSHLRRLLIDAELEKAIPRETASGRVLTTHLNL